jgi:hypothetical protein
VALLEVYAYHRRTDPMMTNVIRDAQLHPLTREMAEPYFRTWCSLVRQQGLSD